MVPVRKAHERVGELGVGTRTEKPDTAIVDTRADTFWERIENPH